MKNHLKQKQITDGDALVIVGETKNELGGSEYYEYIHKFIGGNCPVVDFKTSKNNMNFVLNAIKKNLVKASS